MHKDVEEILYSEDVLKKRVAELGAEITKDYAGKSPLLVGVLKGSFIFMADLVRSIDLPATVEFMVVSSYGSGTVTSGAVQIIKDLEQDVGGKDILIIEDILDSGNTLSYLKGILEQRGAASIKICTLLDKPARRKAPITPDYSGFEVEDKFIVGYGLDYAEKYRNLPYIGVLAPRCYQ